MKKPARAGLEVAVSSEKGLRDENQDWLSWTQIPRGELFVVADGMGGYEGGMRAARMTAEGIEKQLADAPTDVPFDVALQNAVSRTNAEVHRLAHSGDPETQNMGSTLVAALIAAGQLQVGHVGDSRAYLYRKRKLRLLTRDHTRVQEMLDAGMLTPEQARTHPEGHLLSRAIGSRPEVEVEVSRPIPLEAGDCLLLCSDGLTGYVSDEQIAKTLKAQKNVQRVPGDLVNLALESGGSDNVTVQFIRVGTLARGAVATPTSDERVTARLPVLTTLRVSRDAARVARNAALSLSLAAVAIASTLAYIRWPDDANVGAMSAPASSTGNIQLPNAADGAVTANPPASSEAARTVSPSAASTQPPATNAPARTREEDAAGNGSAAAATSGGNSGTGTGRRTTGSRDTAATGRTPAGGRGAARGGAATSGTRDQETDKPSGSAPAGAQPQTDVSPADEGDKADDKQERDSEQRRNNGPSERPEPRDGKTVTPPAGGRGGGNGDGDPAPETPAPPPPGENGREQ